MIPDFSDKDARGSFLISAEQQGSVFPKIRAPLDPGMGALSLMEDVVDAALGQQLIEAPVAIANQGVVLSAPDPKYLDELICLLGMSEELFFVPRFEVGINVVVPPHAEDANVGKRIDVLGSDAQRLAAAHRKSCDGAARLRGKN